MKIYFVFPYITILKLLVCQTLFLALFMNPSFGASDNNNLLIKFTVSSKSKIKLAQTDIALTADPEENIAILSESADIVTQTRTGGISATTLAAATELVSSRGTVMPLHRTVLAGVSGRGQTSWREVDPDLFGGDLWEALIMNVDFRDQPEGPAVAVLTYTLTTP